MKKPFLGSIHYKCCKYFRTGFVLLQVQKSMKIGSNKIHLKLRSELQIE